jgi:hypothetical protein
VSFERDGYVIVENALGDRSVAGLTEAVDRVWAEERPDGTALHLLGFLGRDRAFVELVDHPKTFPLVSGLLGWNIYVYHCHLDVHPPLDEPPSWRWHQDGGRQNLEVESPRPRLSVKGRVLPHRRRLAGAGRFPRHPRQPPPRNSRQGPRAGRGYAAPCEGRERCRLRPPPLARAR